MMIKNKILLSALIGALFSLSSGLRADRLEDAIRATNLREVYELMLVMENTVSSARKAQLISLAKEVTQQRAKEANSVQNSRDVKRICKSIAMGGIALMSAAKVVSDIRKNRARGVVGCGENAGIGLAIALVNLGRLAGFSLSGIVSMGLGIHWLRKGLRCEIGKELYAQAQQIEKRINELKVRSSASDLKPWPEMH